MSTVDPADALIGRTIAGKYVIESLLGGGAMGSVYKARQFALDKTVAIKVMRTELTSDGAFVGRFHREAKAASKMAHAHSIGVTDFGEEADGLLYIVMELVAGRDLERIMWEDGVPLADRRVVDILSQVLSAVAVAHDLGIVHRDLKPANILIVDGADDEGNSIEHVKVCDFGIASMRGTAEPDAPTLSNARHPLRESGRKLTAVGALLGTPEYMSPEQASGLPLDGASDLYSIGAILFELLTGRTVYVASSPEEMVLLQMSGAPEEPRRVRACNEGLAAVCMRALAKEPRERYPSARAMRSELRAALGSHRLVPPPPGIDGSLDPSRRPAITQSALALSVPRADGRDSSAVEPPAHAATEAVSSPGSSAPPLRRGEGAAVRGETSPSRPPRSSRRRWLAVVGALGLLAVGSGYLAVPGERTAPPSGPTRLVPSGAATLERASATSPSAADLVADIQLPSKPPDGAPRSGTSTAAPSRPAAGISSRGPSALGAAAPAPTDVPSGARENAGPSAISALPPRGEPANASATAARDEAPLTAIAPAQPATPELPAANLAAAVRPFTADAARVTASVVGAARTSRSSVASLISHVSFDECYRNALRTLGHAEGGTGSAHLEIDEDGVVRSAQVTLPPALATASGCFASNLRGQRVNVPDTGAATADVSFLLVPN